MIKLSTIILLVITIFLNSQLANAQAMLKLYKKITSIEKEELNDRVVFNVKSNMSFRNVGDKPILLLIAAYPESSPFSPDNNLPFLGICTKITGVLETERTEKVLMSGCALPSIESTADWRVLSKQLDSKTPPPALIKKLEAGESFDFKTIGWLRFFKKRELYSSFADEAIWSEIENAKSLSLQNTYRIWSLELEPRSAKGNEKPFGKQLQKRWNKYGYLWLDDIVSEPIPLNLSSVVEKNDS